MPDKHALHDELLHHIKAFARPFGVDLSHEDIDSLIDSDRVKELLHHALSGPAESRNTDRLKSHLAVIGGIADFLAARRQGDVLAQKTSDRAKELLSQ